MNYDKHAKALLLESTCQHCIHADAKYFTLSDITGQQYQELAGYYCAIDTENYIKDGDEFCDSFRKG